MLDKLGRNINYLRVSLTDRCNLRCVYCMPESGVHKLDHEDVLRFEEVLKVVKAAAQLGITKVRYTGGEPLILKNIDNLIYETSRIEGIRDISLTTNGILLGQQAEALKGAGLNRVNISLDTLKEDRYRKITRGGDIKRVFEAVEKCLKLGMTPVKLNTVLIRGFNEDEARDLMNLTRELPIETRFIELMPIGEGASMYEKGKISSEEIIDKYGQELLPVEGEASSTARLYRLPGAKGLVGFIKPVSCKFCDSCNRIRLTAAGTVKPCLHSEKEYSIKEWLQDEKALVALLRKIIFNKPSEHNLAEEGSLSRRKMYEIGG